MSTVPRRRGGFTILELVLAMALTATLAGAVGYAFVAGLDAQRIHARRQAERDTSARLEDRLTRLLQGAALADDAGDATTYFFGEAEQHADTGGMGCDRLTFTTVADTAPSAALRTDDDGDFEAQHRKRGPVGGVAEVSLGTQAVGNAGDRTGLFLRVQRPSDGDATQGGRESVLSADVRRIGFQFWDGTEWADTWDTQTGERRLPAAVRVSYTRRSHRAEEVASFVVAIPASDVEADHPLSGGGE